MEHLQPILEKIESPLLFVTKNAFRNLSSVKALENVMGFFVSELRSKLLKHDSAGFISHSCDHLLSDFSGCFCDFDELTLYLKIARLEKALHCWQKLKALLSASRTSLPLAHGEGSTLDSSLPQSAPPSPENSSHKLSLPVTILRGVGPKICLLWKKKNVKTVEDLLYFLPRRYEDRRIVRTILQAEVGGQETVMGEITQALLNRYGGRKFFSLTITDGQGILTAKWFRGNLTYLMKTLKKGERVILTGKIATHRSTKNMIHPDFEILNSNDDDLLHFNRIVPFYSETVGLTQKMIRRTMIQAVKNYAAYLPSPLPVDICKKRKLIDMHTAISNAHFPPADHDIGPYNAMHSQAHRRLVFDEFFLFQLEMALKKKARARDATTVLKTDGDLARRFYRLLPYRLTSAQCRVIGEIQQDLASGCTMNRLLQGDVGCGKTVVAFSAMVTCCENGCQAAIMAPTELLAIQHYRTIKDWATTLGFEVVILTGSKTDTERKELYKRVALGKTNIIIGTHALIQEKLVFRNLGLAIIDEQHRFGVSQRADLRRKGRKPHVLVMTATPIPRTLAMTFYGDLDVSVIDELPPGRILVRTRVVREDGRHKVYENIDRELRMGHKAFIVYPLVEESQQLDLKNATDMAAHLQREVFPQYRVGLIHGRMPDGEKERIMGQFLADEVDILVSTTIIEVGIEIPRASLMVIEHAERFGLSQLHQLRGRVGRSNIPSQCILMVGRESSGDALKRIHLMQKSNDGFQIAEMDLALRGPGEFMGTRQAGLPDFRVASMVRDTVILHEAREDAFALVEIDPELGKKELAELKNILQRRRGNKWTW